jgi:hypothetical protein
VGVFASQKGRYCKYQEKGGEVANKVQISDSNNGLYVFLLKALIALFPLPLLVYFVFSFDLYLVLY